jgi:hypothetical protein
MSDFTIVLIADTVDEIKKMIENYICAHCANRYKKCMKCVNCSYFEEKGDSNE